MPRAKGSYKPLACDTSLYATGHVSFNNTQNEFMKQNYKKESRVTHKLIAAREAAAEHEAKFSAAEREERKRAALTVQMNVPALEKECLYDGISRDGGGRAQYLKTRSHKSPQQRFRYPVTTSQMVGWDASRINFMRSPFARRQLLHDSFARPRGVFSFGVD
eukprot:TRINITY_DN67981_c2_g1_i1.p1 TRINITY_DN67981_c2_g1~~TRINITY_DN67981_c2_g1_i1.p1  ORF type:complete len:162 (-),score=14.69 TRINITY_DN67981_c2_g1_i1:102-587(-)